MKYEYELENMPCAVPEFSTLAFKGEVCPVELVELLDEVICWLKALAVLTLEKAV